MKLQEQIKVKDIHRQNRIEDLKAQIKTFHDQIQVKDEQLHTTI